MEWGIIKKGKAGAASESWSSLEALGDQEKETKSKLHANEALGKQVLPKKTKESYCDEQTEKVVQITLN